MPVDQESSHVAPLLDVAPPSPTNPPSESRLIALARLRDLALVPAILVLMLVGWFVDPVFLTVSNLTNVMQQQTELSLVVLAQVLVLIPRRIDLSLESTVGLAPALAIALVAPAAGRGLGVEAPEALAIPICLAVGALVGAINAVLMLRFKLSAFIVTLGMLITLRGLQVGVTDGQSLFGVPSSFSYLGSARWVGLPASVWICVLAFSIVGLCLGYFRPGRSLYAVGGNEEAARTAGIRTTTVVATALIVAGLLAALAGMLYTGRLGSVAANQGSGLIFTVFAAAVIGGVSLDGGKGTIFGALCGVLVLGLINNILTLGGVSAQWNQAIYGGIILLALMLARVTSGKAQD